MLKLILATITLGIIAVAGWFGYKQLTKPQPTPEVKVVQKPLVAAQMTLVANEVDNSRYTLVCANDKCQIKAAPANVAQDARFDGGSWYYYGDVESQNTKTIKHILLKTDLSSGDTKQIIEQTPLTTPRDIIMSPNGKYVAFFLDNVDRPKDKLTELWVYDVDKGGSRILAENLYVPDIHSRVRWNSASTYLYFIADVGPQKQKQDELALMTVGVDSHKVDARFKTMKWEALGDVFERGVIDLSSDGIALAFSESGDTNTVLVVNKDNGKATQTAVKGSISYVQWLGDGSVIYAMQDEKGFTLWKQQEETNRFIARQFGWLMSAVINESEGLMGLVVAQPGKYALMSLELDRGAISNVITALAPVSLKVLSIEPIQAPSPETTSGAANITALEDDELIAFVEQNIVQITGEPAAKPTRVVITDKSNTVFVEYQVGKQGSSGRILVTVNDAINDEWVIRDRYRANGANWEPIQSGGGQEPKSLRLYEWEDVVKKWILKSTF